LSSSPSLSLSFQSFKKPHAAHFFACRPRSSDAVALAARFGVGGGSGNSGYPADSRKRCTISNGEQPLAAAKSLRLRRVLAGNSIKMSLSLQTRRCVTFIRPFAWDVSVSAWRGRLIRRQGGTDSPALSDNPQALFQRETTAIDDPQPLLFRRPL
jgi:hypothetical protein